MTVVDTAEEMTLEEELSCPIILAERVRKSVAESVSFKFECSEIGKQVDRISQMLRSTVRITTSPSAACIYDRPIRRVASDVARNLDRAVSLVRKCRRRSFLHRVVNLVTAADFRKVFSHLDASIADMRWLLSVLSCASAAADGGGVGRERTITTEIVLSLPPIASNDPILSWVWSFTATVQMSGQLPCRIEAANELASLAQDNDRNKKMIVEEGGVPPLLKLLKESASPEAQIAAAIALHNLANDQERVRVIVDSLGIAIIVQVLSDSPMNVQIRVSNLVSRMAEFDDVAKEEFARENVIRPLVSLLSFETFDDVFDSKKGSNDKQTIHSLVQINKEKVDRKDVSMRTRLSSSCSSVSSKYSDGGSTRGGVQTRKEREMESPEVKRELKVNCARALWMLAKNSVSNSRRITETKGLLCLAKLIEKEHGDLQLNCLMTIMEITTAAESNVDLRRSAFKTNSPAAKAVVEQLLRVIKESSNSLYKIPAIRSIGSLSRTFHARETRVIGPLVEQLSCRDHEVGTEAAIALGKFVCPGNFLCQEHAKTVIESNGVIPLMRLLREGETTQIHALILLCYLAIQASNTEALEQARVLTALEGADRSTVAQNPELRELITQAIYHLDLYRGDIHPLRQSSLRI
ncbi:hypothetical protein RND81_11G013700 [Saponaria officinalis]|uniref:DUF7792 domain-containing protein n=1 Tax=Saponaria officinalis TaxID=3572 RepID=A0AAW1HGL3_SAPOF